jgi:2Fe-2S ferredoxin
MTNLTIQSDLKNIENIEKSDDEEAMLSEAYHVQENSRLGCQIRIAAEMDGLKIQLAPEE